MQRKIRINFSDFWHPDTLEAKLNNPLYRLLSKRYELEICERPDYLLFSCFGYDFIRHDCVRIYYDGENRRPNYALCDWAFGFECSNHPRYMRLPFYFWSDLSTLTRERDVDALMSKKSRFCAFVYSNAGASERLKFLDKLSRYKAVDCGGGIRNNIGYRVPDKVAFLQAYKFSIAFENESYPGYTTEKLPEAFAGNTVPIYWGNPLIGKEFNPAAFVNCHDFRNLDQVVEFVVELDRNDALYRQYLGAPAFTGGVPNEYMNEARVLDRFAEIFNTPLQFPVAQTLRGRVTNMMLEPRRSLRLWRQGKMAAAAKPLR